MPPGAEDELDVGIGVHARRALVRLQVELDHRLARVRRRKVPHRGHKLELLGPRLRHAQILPHGRLRGVLHRAAVAGIERELGPVALKLVVADLLLLGLGPAAQPADEVAAVRTLRARERDERDRPALDERGVLLAVPAVLAAVQRGLVLAVQEPRQLGASLRLPARACAPSGRGRRLSGHPTRLARQRAWALHAAGVGVRGGRGQLLPA